MTAAALILASALSVTGIWQPLPPSARRARAAVEESWSPVRGLLLRPLRAGQAGIAVDRFGRVVGVLADEDCPAGQVRGCLRPDRRLTA